MAWVEFDIDNLLPGEPWTSGLAIAAFENPVAIANGAADAPRLKFLPQTQRGFSGTGTTTATFTGLEIYGGFFFTGQFSLVTGAGGAATLSISFSEDGSTFFGSQTIASIGSDINLSASFQVMMDFATGDLEAVYNGNRIAPTVASSSVDIRAVRFSTGGTPTTSSVSGLLIPTGGRSET